MGDYPNVHSPSQLSPHGRPHTGQSAKSSLAPGQAFELSEKATSPTSPHPQSPASLQQQQRLGVAH
jgi:hypothetical protein